VPITGMNHAVLYVRNAEQTARFYERVLDFKVLSMDPQGKCAGTRRPGAAAPATGGGGGTGGREQP
jgi:catechol 2,3-dioxygenase-like lactoylglutathione lyase family enzyme